MTRCRAGYRLSTFFSFFPFPLRGVFSDHNASGCMAYFRPPLGAQKVGCSVSSTTEPSATQNYIIIDT